MRINQEGHRKQILSINIHSDNFQTFLPLTQIYSSLVRSRIICAEMEAFIFGDEQEESAVICYFILNSIPEMSLRAGKLPCFIPLKW